MFMTSSSHDRGVNTFSPEGRIFQIEYAMKAINLSSTALALTIDNGIVMATERRAASPLKISTSIYKIVEIDSHVYIAVSGYIADSNTLVDRARVEAQNHRFTFNEPIPVRALVESLCDVMISFGGDEEGAMSRPFGVSLLVS
ncbi:proteasome A-type subunit, partial [Kipferlia bialata]|eukprot:g2799.t1